MHRSIIQTESAAGIERVGIESQSTIQEILDATPQYNLNVDGIVSDPNGAYDTVTALPPNCGPEQKHLLLLRYLEHPIGIADVICGYPNPETAFIGLLLLREDRQKQGLGRVFYQLIESYIKEELKCLKVRLAVVDSNPVEGYWQKFGFRMTDVARPHEGKNLKSIKRVMEKTISEKTNVQN